MHADSDDHGTRETKARVLVIDDERLIRWSMEQTLRAAGYEVGGSETAAGGLALFEQLRPEVVFLDLHLPDAHGLTVLQRINDGTGARTAVIVMTAVAEQDMAEDALRLGAYEYLEKPFRFERIESLVDRALEATRSPAFTPPCRAVLSEIGP